MDEKDKQEYMESYQQAKKKGVPFFPDIIFKDVLVMLIIFLILVGLAYFIGAPLEEPANPGDTSYTPRPEWYFLFLFQLLRYFPGKIEFIGVVILPTVVLILLFLLPILDKSPKRYYRGRPVIMTITALALVGIAGLSILAVRESPPPAEAAPGDETAALYLENCAPCHGASLSVQAGTNLHDIIAQGRHEGMPAWNADLTTDQIDALAGFILSPQGSTLFTDYCGDCHQASDLVAGNPLELRKAIDQGQTYPPHADVVIPQWTDVLNREQTTSLINFLYAPDGQRLFSINCTPCHGKAVAYSGNQEELHQLISKGGQHLDMPPWQGKLDSSDIDTLANYVMNPTAQPGAKALFDQHCSNCHGQRIPTAKSLEDARQIISTGGAHQTMPVWGDLLTPEQLDALVSYTMQSAKGTPLALGQQLFSQNCSGCHGEFGEGGANPVLAGDVIAPISSAEYLKTRDDVTLRSIIAQGQPNIGMSPFGSSNGGPLESDEIDAIVAYMRSWEENPPVELPPEIASTPISPSGDQIFADLCSQCHGPNGEGGIGPRLNDPDFQARNTDQDIFDTINKGHPTTMMVAWGEILTSDQIQQLVEQIRNLPQIETTPAVVEPTSASRSPTPAPTETPSAPPTFETDVLPIFEAKCTLCHGSMGGWNGTTYEDAMNSGDHGPVVIPGDSANSLLAQKLLGTSDFGTVMPPAGKLGDDEIQVILDWIDAGVLEK